MWKCKFCDTWNPDEEELCPICDVGRRYYKTVTLTRRRVELLNLKGDVVVPEQYTVIGKGAFRSRSDVRRVTLHSAIRRICPDAFYGCINLTEVQCQGSLDSIGARSFKNCIKLPIEKRPYSTRFTATDAFDRSKELDEIPTLISALKKCIKRYKAVMDAQRSRGDATTLTESRIAQLTGRINEITQFKNGVLLGTADEKRIAEYWTVVNNAQSDVARYEIDDAEGVIRKREREVEERRRQREREEYERRRRREDEERSRTAYLHKAKRKKIIKRALAIGLPVGISLVVAAVLLIVLL